MIHKMKSKIRLTVVISFLTFTFLQVLICSSSASTNESESVVATITTTQKTTKAEFDIDDLDTQLEFEESEMNVNISSEERLDLDIRRVFDLTEMSKNTIRFYLFSNQKYSSVTGTMLGSQEIKHKNLKSLKKSKYMKDAPLKILIHGYKNTAFSYFPHRVKNAYLETYNNTNVICVDWRRLGSTLVYFNSAWNAKIVGERIGEFLTFLHHEEYLPSYDYVHIVGFSLGAQVAGFAGKYIWQNTFHQFKIGRITGLDPAGPAFFRADEKRRLDKTDADFTDIIHTSAGKSGIRRSVGHIDFFPNGGTHQPGCKLEKIVDPLLQDCSHRRAPDLFEESILGAKMYGCQCGSVLEYKENRCNCINKKNKFQRVTSDFALLGEYVNITQRGNYFLLTDAAPPFALTHTYILDNEKPHSVTSKILDD